MRPQVGELNRKTRCNAMITKFMCDEDGATAIEYGLIAALIAVVIITALIAVGSSLSTAFNTVESGVKKGAKMGASASP